MVTRCQIKLFDSGVALYKHYDSYPFDDEFLGKIRKMLDDPAYAHLWNRIDDGAYVSFRFVEALVAVCDDAYQEAGYGLSSALPSDIHGDLSYLYWITVENGCFVLYWKEAGDCKNFPTENDTRVEFATPVAQGNA